MPTTTKVSKTKVNTLTRDIRRSADEARNVIDMLDSSRHFRPGTLLTLDEAIDRSPKAMERVHNALGEIEGTVALLRELLNLED